ncbi:hypothetical protein EDD86DRAFT_210701 [Gorgonomyces haynaldii]|nr:hypothetical protein EDD86DRAFT_210701 [Gorgonomyces haynaldii]
MLFLASSVAAHVTLNPPVSTGSYSAANVRVPHGCNSTATISVSITIPQGVSSVKPSRVNGWQLSIAKRPLAVPITSESGQSITDEVDTVTWNQGNLPDEEYQDFGLTFKLPPAEDGKVFYFPVVQQCISGFNNWTMIPSAATPKPSYPAPSVTVFQNGTLAKYNATQMAVLAGSKSDAMRSTVAIGALAALLVL